MNQRGFAEIGMVLFLLIVVVATAVHEISIGHSPFGDKPNQEAQK